MLEVSSTDETNPAGTRKCIRRRWRRWRKKEREVGAGVELEGWKGQKDRVEGTDRQRQAETEEGGRRETSTETDR